jgi:hypothetical protein
MCRIVLPGGRDPQQPCGLCAGAEIALYGGPKPFSYLPVATCASRQTSPRKISIRFWLTGCWLKNKKFVRPLYNRYSQSAGRATPSVANDSRSHSAWARWAAWAMWATATRPPTVSRRACGQCGQFFDKCICGQCGQFVFGCPHCPQSDGREQVVGHVGQMVTEIKSQRLQRNARQPLRAVCLYSSISFLT